jgi:hypothetical protein
MQRFDIYKVDEQTFVVFDTVEKREICACSNYDNWEDAEERAKKIAKALIQNLSVT